MHSCPAFRKAPAHTKATKVYEARSKRQPAVQPRASNTQPDSGFLTSCRSVVERPGTLPKKESFQIRPKDEPRLEQRLESLATGSTLPNLVEPVLSRGDNPIEAVR